MNLRPALILLSLTLIGCAAQQTEQPERESVSLDASPPPIQEERIMQDMDVPAEEMALYRNRTYGFSLRYPKNVLDGSDPQAGCLAEIAAVERPDGVILAQKENFIPDATGQCVADEWKSDEDRAREMRTVLESLADSSTYYGSHLQIYAQRIGGEKALPDFVATWKNRGDCTIGERIAREDGSYRIRIGGGNPATNDTLSCTESTVLYHPETKVALGYLLPLGRSDFFISTFARRSSGGRHAYDAVMLDSIKFE